MLRYWVKATVWLYEKYKILKNYLHSSKMRKICLTLDLNGAHCFKQGFQNVKKELKKKK